MPITSHVRRLSLDFLALSFTCLKVQGDQNVSVQRNITIQYYLAQSDCLEVDRHGQMDTRLTLTPSVIHNSNYVVMVSDHQVHSDLLITLYI
jgi:hypothetical protein